MKPTGRRARAVDRVLAHIAKSNQAARALVLRNVARWVDMGAYVTAKSLCGPRVLALIRNPRAWQWTPMYLLVLAEAVEGGDIS